MRSVVTGATGFLGGAVARALHDRGDEVVALLRPTSDRSRVHGVVDEIAEGDVTDPASVRAAVEGADRVFHCAALVSFGPDDVAKLHAVNVEGTQHVLDAAQGTDVVVVHVSSLAALGPTGGEVRDESWWSPEPLIVPYEQTKREAHVRARRAAEEGVRVRIGIPGGIYGRGDGSELGRLIQLYQRWPLPLGYLPEVQHSTVNVDDCADALVRIAETGTDGDEYVLAAEVVTLREWFHWIAEGAVTHPPSWYLSEGAVRSAAQLASRLGRMTRRDVSRVTEITEMATRSLAFSGEKAREALGWRPRPLSQGMREVADPDLRERRLNRRRSR
jgi:nucleoside-diphosphate-sugar epimerase